MSFLCCGENAEVLKQVTTMSTAGTEEPDLSAIPLYQEFFHNHEAYERYHIHLIGLASTADDGSHALDKRKNAFGRPRAIDAIADPYVTVKTVGPDTGSTSYFPVGEFTFPVLEDCQTPLWDAKCVLIAKKGSTEGIQFKMFDKNKVSDDEEMFEFTLERSEMPEITPIQDSKWTSFTKKANPGNKTTENMAFHFNIMVTDGADRIVTQEETEGLYGEMENGYVYGESVVSDDTHDDEDNALLQSWKKEGNTKAVFWVLGRNDCFMHPHVSKRLFFEQGYDLFVLNYKQNGHCRKKGWVHDAHFNSHNKHGDFDRYIHDIAGSLQIMEESFEYETLMGYAHSTGGPVLLNYLMERGDGAFDGFIFNSPFLDWGWVGGDLIECVLEHMSWLEKVGAMSFDTKVGVATTPEELKDTPIHYLNEEIVMSDWSSRLWSMYYFDWATRPLYKVPMTAGFATGVTNVHKKLEKWHKQKKAVTSKPFLLITSRGDDVLKAPETLSRADWIGPGRWEIELNDNGHDVFLSYDQSETDMALDMVASWLKCKKFV